MISYSSSFYINDEDSPDGKFLVEYSAEISSSLYCTVYCHSLGTEFSFSLDSDPSMPDEENIRKTIEWVLTDAFETV